VQSSKLQDVLPGSVSVVEVVLVGGAVVEPDVVPEMAAVALAELS
jgi:hypothetical protein